MTTAVIAQDVAQELPLNMELYRQSVYSIVIPVYNSEDVVRDTVKQIVDFFESHRLSFEIVLVNDGSKDNSWEVIKDLAQRYEEVKSIDLLKNYGQHSAVLCGMANATGDYMVTMDDDLQNPPAELIHLIRKINEGYDLVFARFHQKKHSLGRRVGSKVVGYLNAKVFDKPKEITLTNFRIFTKEVAEMAVGHRTFYPYIPGLLLMYSSKVANVPTDHHARMVGQSNYSLMKILKLVSRLLFNYSSFPLKVLTFLGGLLAIGSALIGAFFLIRGFIYGSEVKGWTTLVVLISVFNGFTILMMGVMGEYMIRMIRQMSVDEAYKIKKKVD